MPDTESFILAPGDRRLAGIPEIVMFGSARHRTAEPQLAPHYNAGVEICLCRSGIYRWNVEGATVEIRPGEMSVTRPWQLHSGRDSLLGPGRLDWVILRAGGPRGQLDAPLLEELLGDDSGAVVNAFRQSDASFAGAVPSAPAAFERMRVELFGNSPGRIAVIRAQASTILVDVARRLLHGTGHGLGDRLVPDGVLAVLGEAARNPGRAWTASGMAERAGLGITAFTEWCRRATGRPPRWYVLECRLEQAREELASGTRTITEIALDTGFSSSQHLSSAFRKLYGESPSAYRGRVAQP